MRFVINGTNDAAIITGNSLVNLTETNAVLTASGTLTSTDLDGTTNAFTAEIVSGAYGSLTMGGNGAWSYTASSAQNQLARGVKVGDTFTIHATDSTSSSITVNITGTNDAPVFVANSSSKNITYVHTLDSNIFVSDSGGFIATDVDSLSSELRYGIVGGIADPLGINFLKKDSLYGTFILNINDGSYTFKPNNAAINAVINKASETFTITASDGLLTSNATYTVNITDTPIYVTAIEAFNAAKSDGVITFDEVLSISNARVQTESTDHTPNIDFSAINLDKYNYGSWTKSSGALDLNKNTATLNFINSDGSTALFTYFDDSVINTSTSGNWNQNLTLTLHSKGDDVNLNFSDSLTWNQTTTTFDTVNNKEHLIEYQSTSIPQKNFKYYLKDNWFGGSKLNQPQPSINEPVYTWYQGYPTQNNNIMEYSYGGISFKVMDHDRGTGTASNLYQTNGGSIKDYALVNYSFQDINTGFNLKSFDLLFDINWLDSVPQVFSISNFSFEDLNYSIENIESSVNFSFSLIESGILPKIFPFGTDSISQIEPNVYSVLLPLMLGTDNKITLKEGSNSVIDAGAGNDWIIGNSGNNTLNGGDGDDRLNGKGGNDNIDGGLGFNTVIYNGNRSDFQITFLGNGSWLINDLNSGNQAEIDKLKNIEPVPGIEF